MVTSSKVLDVLLTYFGGFKSIHPMRANRGPSPVSTPTPPIKTLMCTSWDSGALLVEEYEALIKAFPELNPELAERVGWRTFRVSCKDFERHGFTDGCIGCRDISRGRTRRKNGAPHNVAYRRRMECRRYLLRQRRATADPRALEAASNLACWVERGRKRKQDEE